MIVTNLFSRTYTLDDGVPGAMVLLPVFILNHGRGFTNEIVNINKSVHVQCVNVGADSARPVSDESPRVCRCRTIVG